MSPQTRNFLVAAVCFPLMACACSRNIGNEPANTPQSSEVVCAAYGGFEEKVCPVSFYALIANPSVYYGRTIALNAYVHRSPDGTIALYPSRESAESGESASSVLCKSGTERCEKYVDKHAETFGKMTPNSDADALFKPLGTLDLTFVRSAKDSKP